MANKTIEAVRAIMAEQAKPWNEEEETEEQYHGRMALEDRWIGGLYYKNNSIEWSHSKSVNYGRQLQMAWDELNKLGIRADGETTVAQAIAKFCARRDP